MIAEIRKLAMTLWRMPLFTVRIAHLQMERDCKKGNIIVSSNNWKHTTFGQPQVVFTRKKKIEVLKF
jgi:hypothetical protein